MKPRLVLGAATLFPDRGGIAKVARLSAQLIAADGFNVKAISYLDGSSLSFPLPVRRADGSKLKFVSMTHLGALQADFCLYDSAGIARSHPRLPGLRRPFAVWMHGVEVWEALRPQAERVLRMAHLVLVNSHYTLARFERLHGPLPAAEVCWLGTEDDEPSALVAGGEGATRGHPPMVLIVGRIDAGENYKGHTDLIAAWPAVTRARPDARLVIAGGGSGLDVIRARAGSSPAANNIDVLGFVPEAAMTDLWQRASLFAMPSRGEGFGLVYVEAMRHGIPVIASVHDAGAEVNAHGETGFNIDLDRPPELAERLIELLLDAALRRRMGTAGVVRWRENFSRSGFSERLLPLIRNFAKSTES